MLPFLALTAIGFYQTGPGAPPPHNLSEVVDLLRRAGYAFRATGDRGTEGVLVRGGTLVQACIEFPSHFSKRPLKGKAEVLRLRAEFDVPRELPLGSDYPGANGYLARNTHSFNPSLGRTVRAYADVELKRDLTLARVKGEIDRFWTVVGAYAFANGGRFAPARPRDWRRERFPDGLVVTRLNETSMDRLLQSWGWSGPEGNFKPIFDGQTLRGIVEGELLDFSVRRTWSRHPTAWLTIGAYITPDRDAKAWRWISAHKGELPWETKSHFEGDGFSLTKTVDLTNGATLGALRAEIREFARRLRSVKA